MNTNSPLVSVLMPTYNVGQYLAETIESILNQTLSDFELIAVNDGSHDNSLDILTDYAQRETRIRVYTQPNQGIATTRNRCLDLATGKYIAWMDADDIALPKRLKKQVAFMETHPHIGGSSVWLKTFGAVRETVWRYPTDDKTMRSLLIFQPPLVCAAAILRRDLIEQFNLRFDTSFRVAEDYDFWSKVAEHTQIANLPEVLYLYRVHTAQITERHKQNLQELSYRVQTRYLDHLQLQLTPDEFNTHSTLNNTLIPDQLRTPEFIEKVDQWLQKLQAANQATSIFPEPAFSSVLAQRWFLACRQLSHLGWWAWQRYWESSLSQHFHIRSLSKAKFFVYSVIGKQKV